MSGANFVGTAVFRVNGIQYQITSDDVTFNPLRVKRDRVVGMDGSAAIQEEFVSPWIQLKVRNRGDIDPIPLLEMENATITLELNNNTVWTLSNAAYTGEGDFNVKDGAISVEFKGESMKKISG